jgi:hypothetical protein
VDWINYIYYNQQTFVNYIRDAVRGTVEQLGPVEGLKEVPKGDKWSRRHLSFPGNLCLHLRDISAPRKGYKTKSPT